MSKQQVGKQGESLAQRYLQDKQMRILATNWRCNIGEIDIIAQDKEHIVFVEVRTRQTETTETAFASITLRKQTSMINSAHTYLSQYDSDDEKLWRIDVIGVALHRDGSHTIKHVEDALGW